MTDPAGAPREPGDWRTPAGLRARIESALAGRRRRLAESGDRLAAAVLMLLVFRDDEARLVLTKKTESVPHHKGQFSFPGGSVEPRDPSRVETALREAEEEIDLDRSVVDVLGLLDDTPTGGSNFVITPVVAMARVAPTLVPDGREIERVVEVALERLLDPRVYHEEWWERGGVRRPIAFFTVDEDVIWGATGRILRDFLDLVFPWARPDGAPGSAHHSPAE